MKWQGTSFRATDPINWGVQINKGSDHQNRKDALQYGQLISHLETRLADKIQATRYHPGVELGDELLVVVGDGRRQGIEPGLHEGEPSEHGGLHVDHAAARDGGRGGNLQVHGFKDEVGSVGELDDLTAH